MTLPKQFLSGVKQGMHNFSSAIALIINSALLTLVYFIGIGVTSLFARFANKKFLLQKISQKRKTYWVNLDLGKKPLEEYFKQF